VLVAAVVGSGGGLACQASARWTRSEPSPDVPDVRGNPATAGLQALLAGYGIIVDRAQLDRECQVDDSGASIDQLEIVARNHGLRASQELMPAEHVLRPEALSMPALVVVRADDGSKQFDVVWRRDGDRVQILDPKRGRQWVSAQELIGRMYRHTRRVTESSWIAWSTNEGFLAPLRARIASLGFSTREVDDFIGSRDDGETIGSHIAALDAAVRAMERRPPDPPGNRQAALEALLQCAKGRRCDGVDRPAPWLFTALPGTVSADGTRQAILHGTVLIRVTGRKGAPTPLSRFIFLLALAWSLAVTWKMISALQSGRPYIYAFWDGGALRSGRVCERRELKLKLVLHFLLEGTVIVTALGVLNPIGGWGAIVLILVIDVAAGYITRSATPPPAPGHRPT
jgi:hypothetical protein